MIDMISMDVDSGSGCAASRKSRPQPTADATESDVDRGVGFD
jgi:hypothetical protein